MLTAMVMVCSLVSAGDCAKFTDTRGPYKTEKECMARIEEMISGINPTLPPTPKQYYFKCEELQKGVST